MSDLTASAHILIRRPREAVFDAIVDADTMSRFWFTRRDSGLTIGTSTWFVGDGPDAMAVEVDVVSLVRPAEIVYVWDEHRTVTWTFEEVADATRLSIEESGFTGTDEEIVEQALDSTGGFNQVIVALKALLEHGAVISVVADHA